MSEGGGDCFPTAVVLAQELNRAGVPDVRVCHGVVTGQGPVAGQRFDHAWVEAEAQFMHARVPEVVVFDFANGNRGTLRRARYYEIGRIDGTRVLRYSMDEVAWALDFYKHWGPWDGTCPPMDKDETHE